MNEILVITPLGYFNCLFTGVILLTVMYKTTDQLIYVRNIIFRQVSKRCISI